MALEIAIPLVFPCIEPVGAAERPDIDRLKIQGALERITASDQTRHTDIAWPVCVVACCARRLFLQMLVVHLVESVTLVAETVFAVAVPTGLETRCLVVHFILHEILAFEQKIKEEPCCSWH